MNRLFKRYLTRSFPPAAPIYASDSMIINPTLKEKLVKIDENKLHVLQKNLDPSSISMLYRVKLGFHSNAIEGNSLNESQVIDFIQNGIVPGKVPFRDLLDVYHHDYALRYVLDSTLKDTTLMPEDIRKIHSIVFPPTFIKGDAVIFS